MHACRCKKELSFGLVICYLLRTKNSLQQSFKLPFSYLLSASQNDKHVPSQECQNNLSTSEIQVADDADEEISVMEEKMIYLECVIGLLTSVKVNCIDSQNLPLFMYVICSLTV